MPEEKIRYWKISSGGPSYRQRVQHECIKNNVIAVGDGYNKVDWKQTQFGDLTAHPDKNKIKRFIATQRGKPRRWESIVQFLEMNPNDKVVFYDTCYKIKALAEIVEGGYGFDKTLCLPYTKPVKWIKVFSETDEKRDIRTIIKQLKSAISRERTIVELTKADWNLICSHVGVDVQTDEKSSRNTETSRPNKEMPLPHLETDEDIKEQEELLPEIEKKSREEIIKELQAVTPSASAEIEYKGTRYKRDNRTIAQLKSLRGFKCQICGNYILKRNGKHYIEASHITPKREKGAETPDNILILCPNHHKEFDLGKTHIIEEERTKDKVVFEINGKRHDISLELK